MKAVQSNCREAKVKGGSAGRPLRCRDNAVETIDSLIGEHATLRVLASQIGKSLGPRTGTGWDDLAFGALTDFGAARRLFADALKAHEEKEERVISALVSRCDDHRAELEPVIEKAHASLNALMAMLDAVSSACDGKHIHAVRTVAERLREELEAHLAYEEKVLFPLLSKYPCDSHP